ncbi:MAG: two-component regulator propeller domain-containing protein [Bacteroidota bacterium]
MSKEAVLRSIILAMAILPSPGLSQTYPFKLYTALDGLAQSSTSSIHQDSLGNMWFGAWGGITRYDGKRFWTYSNSALKVSSICEGPDRTIWLGTMSGITVVSGDEVRLDSIGVAGGVLPSDEVRALCRDKNGAMWVGTARGLVVLSRHGKYLSDSPNALRKRYITGLAPLADGSVLVASSKGIDRCQQRDGTIATLEVLLDDAPVKSLMVRRTGEIIAVMYGQQIVIRYHNSRWDTVFSLSRIDRLAMPMSLGEDMLRNIWIGTTHGLCVLESDNVSFLTRREGLPNQYIGSILRDREGTLWLGSEGGVIKVPTVVFRNYDYSTGLPGDHVISVFEDDQRNIWLGTYRGVVRIAPFGKVRVFQRGLPHPSVHDFCQDSTGRVWIGTHEGLMEYVDGRLRPSSIPRLRNVPIIRLLADRDGNIYCGSRKTILHVSSRGSVQPLLGDDQITEANVTALLLDGDGTLWFGTDGEGGGFIRDARVHHVGKHDGLPNTWITSLCKDRRGVLWVTTQGGAAYWTGDRFTPIPTTEDVLRQGTVTCALRDSSGLLWFGTQTGMYAWDDSIVGYIGNEDGLVASAVRAGLTDRNGNLWIGTVGGVSRIDRAGYRSHHATPPVEIEGLAFEDGILRRSSNTAYAYDENTFTLHFNVRSFVDEEHTEFRFKLSGVDRLWQYARNRREVRFTQLPPGEYLFSVQARNRQSDWSDTALLAFSIQPPLWGTWWFRLLSLGTLAVSLALFYRRRVHGLEKEKRVQQEFSLLLMESQEHERKRIAGELHDSLGQDLLVIKNRALVGLKDPSLSTQTHEQLDVISSVATKALDGVREIAYDLRPYQLDRLGLTKAILSITNDLTGPVQFAMDADQVDDAVAKDKAIHVYRIVQEGINNILRHADARTAWVTIRRTNDTITIVIKDDGKGMSVDPGGRPDGRRGLGLIGLTERAKALNGLVTFASSPDTGTTLTISFPAKGTSP